MPVSVLAEPLWDGSGARVGVTVTGLGLTPSTITLWRSYDDQRDAVAGERRVVATDGAYIIDNHAPVGRPVKYEVEVLTGPDGAQRAYSAPVVVDTGGQGILSDPLVPQSWVPLVGTKDGPDSVYLLSPALQELERKANSSIFTIMGNDKPMALFGQRLAESGLDTSVGTRSAEQNARLESMLKNTSYLLFRPSPTWGLNLPGVMFILNPSYTQVDKNKMMGGDLTWWNLKSDVVGAPTIRVLTATFTWGDVAIMFDTWGQQQAAIQESAAAAGESPTWLYNLKHPIG
jgi:hypothetical protein